MPAQELAPRPRHARTVLAALAIALVVTGCSHSMAFSDTASISVVGHPPAPPPPPEPPPPPAPEPPKRVEVLQDQIVIREKIQFETDQAVIKPESFDLMNEIVGVVNGNPQLKKLSIEGHTDNVGTDKHNQKLSDKRAAAVRTYMVAHSVASERLVSKGWGKTKPLADNDSEEGREHNRRVEFIIVEQDVVRKTYEIDPATGKPRPVTSSGSDAPAAAAPSQPEAAAPNAAGTP
jgi:outer membrane protein OmpA-like peptidoglycan-associated protein